MQLGFLFLVPLLYWILHVVSPFSIWYVLLRSLMLRNTEMRWYKTHVARSMRSPHHPIIQKWVKLHHHGMVYCNLFIGNSLIYDLLYYDETYEMNITPRQFSAAVLSLQGLDLSHNTFFVSLFSEWVYSLHLRSYHLGPYAHWFKKHNPTSLDFLLQILFKSHNIVTSQVTIVPENLSQSFWFRYNHINIFIDLIKNPLETSKPLWQEFSESALVVVSPWVIPLISNISIEARSPFDLTRNQAYILRILHINASNEIYFLCGFTEDSGEYYKDLLWFILLPL